MSGSRPVRKIETPEAQLTKLQAENAAAEAVVTYFNDLKQTHSVQAKGSKRGTGVDPTSTYVVNGSSNLTAVNYNDLLNTARANPNFGYNSILIQATTDLRSGGYGDSQIQAALEEIITGHESQALNYSNRIQRLEGQIKVLRPEANQAAITAAPDDRDQVIANFQACDYGKFTKELITASEAYLNSKKGFFASIGHGDGIKAITDLQKAATDAHTMPTQQNFNTLKRTLAASGFTNIGSDRQTHFPKTQIPETFLNQKQKFALETLLPRCNEYLKQATKWGIKRLAHLGGIEKIETLKSALENYIANPSNKNFTAVQTAIKASGINVIDGDRRAIFQVAAEGERATIAANAYTNFGLQLPLNLQPTPLEAAPEVVERVRSTSTLSVASVMLEEAARSRDTQPLHEFSPHSPSTSPVSGRSRSNSLVFASVAITPDPSPSPSPNQDQQTSSLQ